MRASPPMRRSEVAVDGLPGRKVRGQVPPGASGPVQVQDRLDDPPGRPDPGPAPPPRPLSGQVHGDHLPLCAIPRPTGTPEIAEEERPGVTPWRAHFVLEICPRKNGAGGLGHAVPGANHPVPYYLNRSRA